MQNSTPKQFLKFRKVRIPRGQVGGPLGQRPGGSTRPGGARRRRSGAFPATLQLFQDLLGLFRLPPNSCTSFHFSTPLDLLFFPLCIPVFSWMHPFLQLSNCPPCIFLVCKMTVRCSLEDGSRFLTCGLPPLSYPVLSSSHLQMLSFRSAGLAGMEARRCCAAPGEKVGEPVRFSLLVSFPPLCVCLSLSSWCAEPSPTLMLSGSHQGHPVW